MDVIWTRLLSEYYAKCPTRGRFTNITVSMFWPKGASMTGKKMVFPKLKGKGHEIKVLIPALVWLWDQYRTQDDPEHDQIWTLLQCSEQLDVILDVHAHDDVLTADSADRFMQAGSGDKTSPRIWGNTKVENDGGGGSKRERG